MSSLKQFLKYTSALFSANDHHALLWEAIFRHFQIQRCRSLSHTTRNVVVAAMAWAEPAAKVARLANGYASKMCADAEHDEPLWFLDTVLIALRVSQDVHFDVPRLGDFGFGAVADEDWFAAPFDDDL